VLTTLKKINGEEDEAPVPAPPLQVPKHAKNISYPVHFAKSSSQPI
jgi:hypothetical protein